MVIAAGVIAVLNGAVGLAVGGAVVAVGSSRQLRSPSGLVLRAFDQS